MSTMTTEIQQKAAEALSWFEIARRDENDDDTSFVRVKDGAPEWITQLVYAAHGEFLPDDWRYCKIQDALEFITDVDDPDDASGEFADDAVDVYTGRRLAWLGSSLSRVGYCDDAARDYGHGITDIVTMIGWGQYAEAEEIYASVLNSLSDAV